MLKRNLHGLVQSYLSICVLAGVLFCSSANGQATPTASLNVDAVNDSSSADGKWIQLFNGKNLDGWTPKIR
ncbi:MAG: DUF1080 domain-containing protein, partial [Planctomycetota bacterium]